MKEQISGCAGFGFDLQQHKQEQTLKQIVSQALRGMNNNLIKVLIVD